MRLKFKPKTFNHKLQDYRTNYLKPKFSNLDESSTRILVNHLLHDVLGFKELDEIKTEYPIPGGFIDYLIQINRENMIVVEAKSIAINLKPKHLRQAIYYAVMVGAEWIILTNGRIIELYQLSFTKPVTIQKLATIDLKLNNKQTKYLTSFLTSRSMKLNRAKKLVK